MIRKYLLSPFEKFVRLESLAGFLLFGMTIIALVWANSPFAESYADLWKTYLGFSFDSFELSKPLILWVNDGLMAIFFFVIGLELKRELLVGELDTLRKAAFPIVAAIGGVVVPVILYLILNQDPLTTKGWGIPMATDIAFALAILTLLGDRVPLSLKIFLTAFAIIDDIAAVLVIAIFYSAEIQWMYLVYGLVIIGLLAAFYKFKGYSLYLGIGVAVIVWYLFLKSGIHPTIAGVLLALTIPLKRKINLQTFSRELEGITNRIQQLSNADKDKTLLNEKEMQQLDDLSEISEDVSSPLQHLEHKLHNIVAYLILPIFAFANAGVAISTGYDFNYSLLIVVAVSMVVGKFVGVTFFCWLGNRLKLIEFPEGSRFVQIMGVAAIAGVGFTMSIFIDNLAFYGDAISINSAKVGIIIGSIIAGLTGYLILRFSSRSKADRVS